MVTKLCKRAALAFQTLVYILMKGGDFMQDTYVGLVIVGRRTCNPENKRVRIVPPTFIHLVAQDLEALGLDLDGKPLA